MFEVKLKAGHPTGTYHRAGRVFVVGMPEKFDKVPKTIENDAWLEVTEVKPVAPAPVDRSDGLTAPHLRPFDGFDGLTVEQLKKEAIKRTILLPGGLNKAEIIELLVKFDADRRLKGELLKSVDGGC